MYKINISVRIPDKGVSTNWILYSDKNLATIESQLESFVRDYDPGFTDANKVFVKILKVKIIDGLLI